MSKPRWGFWQWTHFSCFLLGWIIAYWVNDLRELRTEGKECVDRES